MRQNPFIFESEGLDNESRFDEMYEFDQGEYDEAEFAETEFDETEYDEAEYGGNGSQYEEESRRPIVRDPRSNAPRAAVRDPRSNVSRPVVRDHRSSFSRPAVRAVPGVFPRGYGRPVRSGYWRSPVSSMKRFYPGYLVRPPVRNLAYGLTPKYPWRRPYPPPWRYPHGRRYPSPPWYYPRGRRYFLPQGQPPAPGAVQSTSSLSDSSGVGAGAPVSAPEPSSELVRMIQLLLNRLLNLNIPVDGVMNVETRNAMSQLQNQQGAPGEPPGPPSESVSAAGGDQPQSEYYEFEDEYGDYESGDYEYGDYEYESPFAFEVQPTAAPAVNLASTPCPLHKPGKTTARCRTEQQCPAIPNLLCVTTVNNIPFEYVAGDGMIRRNRQTGLYEVVKRLANRKQKFIPQVGQALARFLAEMNRAGMPVEAILTAGTLYCRCITGTNRLSNHSFGDAIDIVGIRWRAPGGARETLVHNYQNPAERAILRRIDACLRLSFPNVIDYYHHRHRDHFHCDMNRGRGRVLRSVTSISFVQEALGKLTGQQLRITGKLDVPTQKALSAFSGRRVQELARADVLGQVLDNLFERAASA